MNQIDTIAAIATGLGNSSIGIVRISGSEAVKIADKVYRSKKVKKRLGSQKTHTIHYGYVYDRDILVDEVMVVIMRGPNSYTTEDTVEINCHGGAFVTNKILETIIKHGARPAEPGEFTKRAFLNGRIDLSKAEAVLDLIESKNDYALRSSLLQLSGALYEEIKKMRNEILYEIAFIESALDDPEHISTEGYSEKLEVKVEKLLNKLEKMLKDSKNGKILKEGIDTVILGKPNVGKSTFLNLLLGEERAIVTDLEGTTRDILKESICLKGIQLNVMDTAGIRNTEDIVEKIGVDRAKECALKADLILYVVDTSVPLDINDKEIMNIIKEKNTIILLNKSDLNSVVTRESLLHLNKKIIWISAKENIGMEQLEEEIEKMFLEGKINFNDELFLTNMRHIHHIKEAYESLVLVKESIRDKMTEDFYSIDLMNGYTSLGMIIGEETGEDVVNEIFSKFCMGK
jgi:tRNA modification GTPase